MSRLKLALCVLLVLAFSTVTAHAEAPTTSRLLGGKPINLLNSQVALILTKSYLCSGALLGPNTVITAAHCIKAPTDEYRVYLGGREFKVAAAYYNNSFKQDKVAVTLDSARVDMGALVLDGPVPGIEPIPIRSGLAVQIGERALIRGYGASEGGEAGPSSLSDIGRTADIRIEQVDGTLFATSHVTVGASTCAGDSGGPVLQRIGDTGTFAAIGIVVAGSNRLDAAGNCVQNQSGISVFVDLQSEAAQRFLSQFDLTYVPGTHMLVLSAVSEQLSVLKRTSPEKSRFSNLAERSAASLARVRRLADEQRQPLLRQAITELRKAALEQSGKVRARSLKRALRSLLALRDLGV